jgi:U4/U6 small nuclear ribonucleoprotein PRP31
MQRIKNIYGHHFPELESLVLNPIDYSRVVKMIGNETDMTLLDLKSILPSATVMVINVTATTTNGRQLTPEELIELNQACDIIQEMDLSRKKMLEYVASRMSIIAPNLTVLLGSATAAKLMTLAGGLTALSKIPSCNLLVVGVQKKALIGLSRVSTNKHEGVIFECELIQKCPKHIHRKAGRLVAAKCALACRVDLSREYPDGRMGDTFRHDIQKKIDLLVEPPPAKKTKALPLPIEFKKRRGGKRARREKERLAGSELQKASNRMAFGEAEEEIIGITGESIGLGLIGGSTGKLRLKTKDSKFKGIL